MSLRLNAVGIYLLLLCLLSACPLAAQMRRQVLVPQLRGDFGAPRANDTTADWTVEIRPAAPIDMPGPVDSNSPAYWSNGEFYLINSTGSARISQGPDQFHLGGLEDLPLSLADPSPAWIEAVWPDDHGVIFAWYHQEVHGLCDNTEIAVPRIGAAVSFDNGRNFSDLGIVLASGDPIDCSSQNGYFAGGHGDFSVMLDASHQFFYILFSNYGGLPENQGVAVARLAFADRFNPSGRVWKYFQGAWSEPGINGRVSPIFPAAASWQSATTDAFWGPSIHWNSYLKSYVVLLNHACCAPGWPQDGVFISFNSNLNDPAGWSSPQQIVEGGKWYPQVLGIGAGETDRNAGQVARFYVYGHSEAEIVFQKPEVGQAILPAAGLLAGSTR